MKNNSKSSICLLAGFLFLAIVALICSCLLHTEKAFADSIDSSSVIFGDNLSKLKSSDDEFVITLDKTSFEENEYILEDWYDIDNNAFDDINVFGQRIDCVKYIIDGNYAFGEFDTENAHGIIVELSNSESGLVDPVTYEIGSGASLDADRVPVVKGAVYDTIRFYPDYFRCIQPTEQIYRLQHPATVDDGYYISLNFINEKGDEQDKICPFGQQGIDSIRYQVIRGEAYGTFDTVGKHGVIVEISNSKDTSVKPVTYEIGSSNDNGTDRVPVVKGAIYDTIRFYPDYAECINPSDQIYRLHPSKYLNNYYISWNFINEKGEEQDMICPFGQEWIDGVKYIEDEDEDKAWWSFRTKDLHGINLEISNSQDSSVKPVTFEAVSSGSCREYLVPVKRGAIYDTIRFYPDLARCVKPTEQIYRLEHPTNHKNNSYISWNFINEKGEEQDKICPFGQQWIDGIKYEIDGDKHYWDFCTCGEHCYSSGKHGVIVEISNSNDPFVDPVTYEIGSNSTKSYDRVPVESYGLYDTIRFYPDYAKCTNAKDQTYKLHPSKYLNNYYISWNFINEKGEEQDKICPFGEQGIDGIKYEENGDKAKWVFDTEGTHGVYVKIYNSQDPSITPVNALIGANKGHDTDDVQVQKGVIYDTIEFSPYKK